MDLSKVNSCSYIFPHRPRFPLCYDASKSLAFFYKTSLINLCIQYIEHFPLPHLSVKHKAIRKLAVPSSLGKSIKPLLGPLYRTNIYP
jgi:hypothetical protein